jgi:flagellar operon protein
MNENNIYRLQQSITPVIPITGNSVNTIKTNQGKSNTVPFDQVLTQELAGVKFSQHALQRLQSRGIKLGQTELLKLNGAVEKAAQKGANESLVFMSNSNLALVVSVKNKTVITVMDGANSRDNVFTNIDSAVIV